MGQDTEQVIAQIEANRHTQLTATYYLLLRRHIIKGGSSIADFGSGTFDPNLLVPQPPNRPSLNQTLPGSREDFEGKLQLDTLHNPMHPRYRKYMENMVKQDREGTSYSAQVNRSVDAYRKRLNSPAITGQRPRPPSPRLNSRIQAYSVSPNPGRRSARVKKRSAKAEIQDRLEIKPRPPTSFLPGRASKGPVRYFRHRNI